MERNLDLTSWEEAVYPHPPLVHLSLISLILRSPTFTRCQLEPSSLVKYAPKFQHSTIWKQCHRSKVLVRVLSIISLFQSIRVKMSL